MIRGICIGTVTGALAQLGDSAAWCFGVGQNSMSDELRDCGSAFVPLTFEQEPNETWARFATWKNYSGYWMLGNEPHTVWDGTKPASEVAQIFMRQMDAVRAFDPYAKFIVACSTQGQLPYNPHFPDENFIGDLWACLPKRYRKMTTGFHAHIYPRWVSDDPAVRWDVKYFVRYIKNLQRWMVKNGITRKEIWVSEFGFEGYFADNAEDYARCVQYVKNLLENKFLQRNVARLAFYVATAREGNDGSNGYLPLLNSSGALTDLGTAWAV